MAATDAYSLYLTSFIKSSFVVNFFCIKAVFRKSFSYGERIPTGIK
jgi:hypothetical protein